MTINQILNKSIMTQDTTTKSMSLYDLQALAFRTELELEDSGGELTPEIEQALATTEVEIPRKVDAYKGYLDFLEARADQLQQTIKSLQNKKKAVENANKRVREYVKLTMGAFGLRKIKGDVYTATLTERDGIEVNEEEILAPYREKAMRLSEELPDYVSVELKVSKTGVAEAIKGNDVLPLGITRTKTDTLTIR